MHRVAQLFRLSLVFVLLSQAISAADALRQAYQAGDQALKEGDLKTAKDSFLQVLRLSPNDVGARVNLGVVFIRLKDWSQALQYLREAEQRAPQVTGIRLNIGLAEYRKGDYQAAIAPFQSVLHDQPDANQPESNQARYLLGLCYLFTERYNEAANSLEPLWPNSHDDLAYLYSLAVAAGNSGQPDLEQKSLAQIMAIGKDSAFLHLLRGKAYLAHEDFGHALEEFHTATAIDPKLPLLHYNTGVVYRRQGNLDKARREFEADLAIEPAVAFDYDQLGVIAYSLQSDQSAETYFRHAVALDAKLGTSWFGLAKIYKKQKRYAGALAAIAKALEIDPNSASAHYLKSQLYAETGRNDDAKTELAAVRRIKNESRDKLEQQFEGTEYRDPRIVTQPPE